MLSCFFAVTNSLFSLSRLSNNALSGPLPQELGNLTALTALALSNCNLTGSVPSSWGALTLLSTLQLDGNRLVGTLPAVMNATLNATSDTLLLSLLVRARCVPCCACV